MSERVAAVSSLVWLHERADRATVPPVRAARPAYVLGR